MTLAAQDGRQRSGFARMLTSLREAHHLSIRGLAEASGVSVAQISALERRWRTGQPDLRVRRQTVLDLARGLRLSSEERVSFMAAAGYEAAQAAGAEGARVEVARALLAATQEGTQVVGAAVPAGGEIPKLPATMGTATEIVEVASSLFETVARPDTPKPPEVILTFQAPGTNVLDAVPRLRHRWETAIASMLDSGIRVSHVWGVREGDIARARDKARNVLAFGYRSDLYEPMLVRPDAPPDVLGIPDMIVVPNYAAMVKMIPGSQAIVLEEPGQVYMAFLAARTVKNYAKKIFYAFRADQEGFHDFDQQFGEDEAGIRGPRQIFKAGPTSLWIQPEKEIDLARRAGQPPEAVRRFAEAVRARFHAIDSQLRYGHYPHRELISRRSVEQFARDRKPPRDSWWARGASGEAIYEVEDVVDALARVIERLDNHPEYELALAGDDLEQGLATAFWEVMKAADGSNSAVFLETWSPGSGGVRGPGLIIREPRLVEGFSSWFDVLWGSVPDRWRNRRHLIPWLEKQINIAESQGATAATTDAT